MHKKDLVKAQKQMEQLQQHIAELSCEGAVSGGLVTVTMSGHYQVMSVEIKPEAMKLERDELGQLISTATNHALEKVQEKLAELRHELALQVKAMV